MLYGDDKLQLSQQIQRVDMGVEEKESSRGQQLKDVT